MQLEVKACAEWRSNGERAYTVCLNAFKNDSKKSVGEHIFHRAQTYISVLGIRLSFQV